METIDNFALRFPIGKYDFDADIDEVRREQWIAELEKLPRQLREAVERLSPEQLDTPYRPEGWTVRQVVHHVADSHMNSYIRFRLALTEDLPEIRTYEEALWAELQDARSGPVEPSLQLLEGLHTRWCDLLRSLGEAEFRRSFRHPALGKIALDWTLGLYAWHSRHHLAHIQNLRRRMNW